MGFENRVERRMAERIDRGRDERRSQEADQALANAHEHALQILSKPGYAISERNFASLYGPKVQNDQMRVREKRAFIAATETREGAENAKAAQVFEAIVAEHGELSSWLGNVTLQKTAAFDDLFHGVDLIAEWKPESEALRVLALAIDVTFGAGAVEQKLIHIRDNLRKGVLAQVDYFQSADGTFRGRYTGSPQVVVGVSRPAVAELARLWTSKEKGSKKALAEHPVQRALLEETCTQLTAMHGFAVRTGKLEMVKPIMRQLKLMQGILGEKKGVQIGHLAEDPVYQEILSQSRAVFG